MRAWDQSMLPLYLWILNLPLDLHSTLVRRVTTSGKRPLFSMYSSYKMNVEVAAEAFYLTYLFVFKNNLYTILHGSWMAQHKSDFFFFLICTLEITQICHVCPSPCPFLRRFCWEFSVEMQIKWEKMSQRGPEKLWIHSICLWMLLLSSQYSCRDEAKPAVSLREVGIHLFKIHSWYLVWAVCAVSVFKNVLIV